MNIKKALLAIILVVFMLFVAGCSPTVKDRGFTQLKAICELASLKGYYHNVAEMEYGGFIFGIGFKKIWIEYGGIVKVGIDANKVSITNPDSNGLVRVTIPNVEILSMDFDENSLKEYAESNLPFNGFSTAEKMKALTIAQEDMYQSASTNRSLMMQGQERAKKVIKQYIEKVGEAIGKQYTVEWVNYVEPNTEPSNN